jgi:hypothetical protein
MTYSVGGKVQATDYNDFVSTGTPNVNNIWGTGSSTSGYGQTALGTVTATTKILANPWASLINTIASMAAHQGSTITAVTPVAAGDKIAFINAMSTNLSTVNTNRLNAAATGTDIVNSATRTTQWGPAVGITQLNSTVTVTFASAAAARYFFNAGGTIRITCSRSGGSAFPANTSWTNLCSDIGAVSLPAVNTAQTIAGTAFSGLTKVGGGGSTPDIYVRNGFYQLTGTPTVLYRQFSNTSVYTNDNIQLLYSATATSVTIVVRFTDIESGPDPQLPDLVDGNLTVTAVAKPPSTANLANSWGTPTVSVTAPA